MSYNKYTVNDKEWAARDQLYQYQVVFWTSAADVAFNRRYYALEESARFELKRAKRFALLCVRIRDNRRAVTRPLPLP